MKILGFAILTPRQRSSQTFPSDACKTNHAAGSKRATGSAAKHEDRIERASTAEASTALQQRIEMLEQQVAKLTLSHRLQQHSVRNYAPIHLLGVDPQFRVHLALRSFYRGEQALYWAVDVESLQTKIIPRNLFEKRLRTPKADGTRYMEASFLESSAYAKLRYAATAAGQPTENAGLTRCEAINSASILTVDLCPSRRPFEQRLFDALIQRATIEQRPMPVTVCISGLWAQENPSIVTSLLRAQSDAQLNITWVNHSYGHNYYSDKPNESNFLLYPGIQLKTEIFETERILLEQGICPSIFFRLPGLVGDDRILQLFDHLGLVPLGSDAWLAKKQQPRAGSIILVHANGNEPEGIDLALPLVQGPDALPLHALHEAASQHGAALPQPPAIV